MRKSNVAFLGLFTAFAMILSFVESQIPMVIPGVKLGLPNIAIIVIMYKFGTKEAIIVSLIRVLLTALLFTDTKTPMAMRLAASWVLPAFCARIFPKKKFSR